MIVPNIRSGTGTNDVVSSVFSGKFAKSERKDEWEGIVIKPFLSFPHLLRMRGKWIVVSLVSVFGLLPGGRFADMYGESACSALSREMKLPVKLKTRGKPRRARWEQIDKVLNQLGERSKRENCRYKFEEVFRTDRKDLYLPVSNSVVRIVPEKALQDLVIYDQSGDRIGEYDSRVTYDRSGGLYMKKSYTLHYFLYRDGQGEVQSTGHELLLDNYLAHWDDISNRIAVSFSGAAAK